MCNIDINNIVFIDQKEVIRIKRVNDAKLKDIQAENIKRVICDKLNISEAQLLMHTRKRENTTSRFIAFSLTTKLAKMGPSDIGRKYGLKPCTVTKDLITCKNLYRFNRDFRDKYDLIEHEINRSKITI